jgi:hypothetical protein
MKVGQLAVDQATLESLCQTWGIQRLEVFGSVLRQDFGAGSDVDLLVTFAPNAGVSLVDFDRIERDFASLFGRGVEVVTRAGVENSRNYIRKRAILNSAELLYAA